MDTMVMHKIFNDFDEVKAKETLLLIGETIEKKGSLDQSGFQEILKVVETHILKGG